MRVRFWGVRGSVPWATPAAMIHGCNTPCVEVRDDDAGAHLILDAGSGLVGLSETLSGDPRRLPVLLSHYHWDHTQGLPFFSPFYTPGWQTDVVAPDFATVSSDWLPSMFEAPNFPVPFKSLPNAPVLQRIPAAPLTIGGFRVSVQTLNHPGGAFAYRVHGHGGDLCYVTDHEFGDAATDEQLHAFCRGCAAIVADAHFTPEELRRHAGWGHGSWQNVAEFAASCGAGHLWLFHHKPGRSDAELDTIVAAARQIFPATSAAREGVTFEI
jgi:phosphoribosyl 1,2-cyclic phosphodiesterase